MLILLISFLIPALINICIQKKNNYYYSFDWGSFGFVTILCGMTIFLIMQIVVGLPFRQWDNTKSCYEIVAMKNGDRISADVAHGLFYFRERIDDDDYYFVMSKNGDSYSQKRVKCSETVIKETTGKPRLITVKQYYIGASGISSWVRFNLADRKMVGESDTLYVPVGTIDANVKWEVF